MMNQLKSVSSQVQASLDFHLEGNSHEYSGQVSRTGQFLRLMSEQLTELNHTFHVTTCHSYCIIVFYSKMRMVSFLLVVSYVLTISLHVESLDLF